MAAHFFRVAVSHAGLPRPNARKAAGSKTTAASAPAAPTYFGFSPENPTGAVGQKLSHKPSATPFARVSSEPPPLPCVTHCSRTTIDGSQSPKMVMQFMLRHEGAALAW